MGTDLPARIGALLEDYRVARARIESLQFATSDLRVCVRAPDRSVTVSVDPSGQLRELRIDPQVAGHLNAAALAARIVATAKLAAAQARAQRRSALRRGLPDHLRDLVGADGSVDLAAVLPSQLENALRTGGRHPS